MNWNNGSLGISSSQLVTMIAAIVIELIYMPICANRANPDTFGGMMLEFIAIIVAIVMGLIAYRLVSAGGEKKGMLAYGLAFFLAAFTFGCCMHTAGGNVFVGLQVVVFVAVIIVGFMRSRSGVM